MARRPLPTPGAGASSGSRATVWPHPGPAPPRLSTCSAITPTTQAESAAALERVLDLIQARAVVELGPAALDDARRRVGDVLVCTGVPGGAPGSDRLAADPRLVESFRLLWESVRITASGAAVAASSAAVAASSGEQPLATDPSGPETGSYRVIRGGSWLHTADYCRSASRSTGIRPTASTSSVSAFRGLALYTLTLLPLSRRSRNQSSTPSPTCATRSLTGPKARRWSGCRAAPSPWDRTTVSGTTKNQPTRCGSAPFPSAGTR